MIANKEQLLAAVNVLEMVPSQQGVASSDILRIEFIGKKVYMALCSVVTGNARFAVNEDGAEEKPFFIDRRLLFPFLLAGKDGKDEIKIVSDGPKLRVTQGSRKAEFEKSYHDVGGYLKWKDYSSENSISLTDAVKKMMVVAATCSEDGSGSTDAFLRCTYVQGQVIMALNTVVMFKTTVDKGKKIEVPFPVSLIPIVQNDTLLGVSILNKKIILDFGKDGYIIGTFPADGEHFPKEKVEAVVKEAQTWPLLFSLDGKGMRESMKNIKSYLSSVEKKNRLLHIDSTDKAATLWVKLDQGTFHERVAYTKTPKQAFGMKWPLEWVQDVLEQMSVEESLEVRQKTGGNYMVKAGQMQLIIALRSEK